MSVTHEYSEYARPTPQGQKVLTIVTVIGATLFWGLVFWSGYV